MENTDVKQDSSPVVTEDVKTPEPVVEVQPEKGSKTPETNLYAALEEERRLRKEAEKRAKELEQTPSDEFYSDEGKSLKKEIGVLKDELSSLKEEKELERIRLQFPALQDKSAEFEQFRKEYPRHKIENVAKLFLVEQGLAEEIQPRKGLERPVAGPKSPASSFGMSTEDVSNLRKTNYKKYLELLTSGKLRPEEIK